jgi:hypothetical protein
MCAWLMSKERTRSISLISLLRTVVRLWFWSSLLFVVSATLVLSMAKGLGKMLMVGKPKMSAQAALDYFGIAEANASIDEQLERLAQMVKDLEKEEV